MPGRKNIKKTSNLAEIQKGIPHLHPMTIPDYQENIGIAKKNWDYQRNKQRLARNQDYQKSQGLAKPRSKPLNLFQQYWRENMKVTIKMINQRAGTVVEQQGLTIQCSVYSCFV